MHRRSLNAARRSASECRRVGLRIALSVSAGDGHRYPAGGRGIPLMSGHPSLVSGLQGGDVFAEALDLSAPLFDFLRLGIVERNRTASVQYQLRKRIRCVLARHLDELGLTPSFGAQGL